MSRRGNKFIAPTLPDIITICNPPLVPMPVRVARAPPPPAPVQAAPPLVPTGVPVIEQTPLIWRHKDVDIELGSRFPYSVDDDAEGVADFEVRGKVVKSFLGKDPMYNQNLNLKATAEDVSRIKAIVRAAPNSDAGRPSFEWPFEANKEGVFKFVNKDNLKFDFAEIFDATETSNIYDVAERRRHSLEAKEVRLGSRAIVEFTIAIWRKKPERSGCTFHLISVGVMEHARDNVLEGFQSPKKRQRTGR